jgi:hypothetical protein
LKKLLSKCFAIAVLLVLLASGIPANTVSAGSRPPPTDKPSVKPNSPSTGTGTTSAPYKNVADSTWTNELALGWANAYSNYNTGFISASAFSYAGGASAQAEQYIDVTIPNGQLSEVTVIASIVYAGGTQKFGIGASSWGGVDKVWYIGAQEHRESLDPIFGWDDIGSAVVDMAITLAPGGVELAGLSQASKVAKVVNAVGNINDAYTIVSGFNDLINAGDAQRTWISFSFQEDNPTQVGVGLRVDTSGAILGACDATVLGYVENFYVYVNPVIANGHWSFNNWSGGSGAIADDSGSSNAAQPKNGVASVGSSRLGKGVRFDGTDDWIQLGFDASERTVLAQQGTIELWIKPEQVAETICVYGGSGSNADGFGSEKEIQFGTDANGRFNFVLSSLDANGFYKWANFGTYVPNTWYHIAVTYTNNPLGRLKFYVNGQRVEPYGYWCSNELLTANLSLDDLRLGKPNADERMFKGEMDEVRIYSRILSDKDIRANCWQGIDSTAPSIPVMQTEPAFTGGTENMVACSPAVDSESGVWQYLFECTPVGDYNLNFWKASPQANFPYLADGVLYSYRVKAKDAMGNESGWSAPVSSMQDATPPSVSAFPIFYTASGQIQGNEVVFDFPLAVSDSSGISSIYTDYTVHDFSPPYPTSISSLQLSIPLASAGYYAGHPGGGGIGGAVTDSVGNWTDFLMDGIYIDYQQPQGSVVINGGNELTNSQTVALSLSYSHPGSPLGMGVYNMRFSNDGSTWSNWESTAGTKSWLLSANYGNKIVYAQFQDGCGHISSTSSDYIVWGPIPSGEIVINNSASWTTSRTINLSLVATNAFEMNVWEGDPLAVPPAAGWEPYASTKVLTLGTSGDGQKTVCVRYRSTAYQQTATYSDTINLDTVAPSGTLSINGGSVSTNSNAVTLTLSASDVTSGLEGMRFDNGDNNWTGWESYQTSKAWGLLDGEGQRTAWVQFRDVAGKIYTVNQNITVDLCPPAGSLAINGNAQFTGSTTTTLSASVTGQDYSLPGQFSSTQGYMGWRYYRSAQPGTYKDLVWDNIVSPDPLKQSYSWNSKAGEDDINHLRITGPDQGSTLQTGDSEQGNVVIGWEVVDRPRTINVKAELWADVPDGDPVDNSDDGVVLSMFRNGVRVGHEVRVFHSRELSYGIVEVGDLSVDQGDVIYFYVDRGLAETNDAMHYNFSITDTSEMAPRYARFSNLLPENIDSSKSVDEASWWGAMQNVTWSTWQLCDPNYQDNGWTIPAGDGLKTVVAQFKDGVGNISHPYRASITLDQTAPAAGSVTINGGAMETSAAAVALVISAADATSGIAQMQITENGAAGSWEPYASQKTWTLSQAGERTISVVFKDAAGNTSPASSEARILFNPLFSGSNPRLGRFSYVQMADVTGDGLPDLLVTSLVGARLGLLVNQGGGRFGLSNTAFSNPIIANVYRVMPADLDNDGDLDLVVIPRDTRPSRCCSMTVVAISPKIRLLPI